MPRTDLRLLIENYVADRGALERLYTIDFSPARRERLARLAREWREVLIEIDFD